MPDRLQPPVRRPAPQHLRDRIARELDTAPSRRIRPRFVLIPMMAASLLLAVFIGTGLVRAQIVPDPVQSASPIRRQQASTCGP